MYPYDFKALSHVTAVKSWKRFCDVFVLWERSRDDLDKFSNFMNFIDSPKKIQFTISFRSFIDLLYFLEFQISHYPPSKQILVDVFSKPTNSFTYVMPSTYFSRRNIEKVPEAVTLQLRRICDTDSKFKIRSNEYQQYLISRTKVTKQFFDVAEIYREIARQPSVKMDSRVTLFLTKFNPLLPYLKVH